MGCVCCSISSFVSIVLNALERISLCTVCALLVCCLLFTIMTVMVIGIGIGFHYCSVQSSLEGMEAEASAAGAARRSGLDAPQPAMRSLDKMVKRGFAHRLSRREADDKMPSNNNTINELLLGRNYTSCNKIVSNKLLAGINFTALNTSVLNA